MNLHEFKSLLKDNADKLFSIQLPGGSSVPVSFHVTEVGRVQKTFIDCGGTLREATTCQLQIWVGEDVDHRLEAGKAAAILEKARSFLPDETIPVELEYEEEVISQYTIEGHAIGNDRVILTLAHKHTECLAPELCMVPAAKAGSSTRSCCATTGCC